MYTFFINDCHHNIISVRIVVVTICSKVCKVVIVPYTDKIVFDGNASFKSLVDSVVPAGDYETWKGIVIRIRKSGRKEPLVYLAASFGSILLKLINIAPFIVNLCGSTSKGKTVASYESRINTCM